MKKPRIPIPDILLTALAPMTWGTTYYVATEFLPPNHPLMAADLRANLRSLSFSTPSSPAPSPESLA